MYIDSHIVISKRSNFCLIWPLAPTVEIENKSLSTSSLTSLTILAQLQIEHTHLSSALTITFQVKYSYNSVGHGVCTKQCESPPLPPVCLCLLLHKVDLFW